MVISGDNQLLQELDQLCYNFMQKGTRPGTNKNTRLQARQYHRFCEILKLPLLPADEWQLIRYTVYTAQRVKTAATVNNYSGGVRKLHKLAGYELPSPSTSPNLKLALAGIKAELAGPTKQAAPMTSEILLEIETWVNFHSSFEFACFSAMLTGFYLIIRASNLVPVLHNKFNPKEQLTRWHMGLDQDLKLALVIIEWSKNNQNQKKQMQVPISLASNSKICLIQVLQRYFKAVPATDVDPCFCYKDENGDFRALSYAQLNKQIKTWVSQTGRKEDRYTSHCLRHSGINHALRCQIEPEFLQIMGDWASTCFLRYVDFELDLRLEAAQKFSRNIQF